MTVLIDALAPLVDTRSTPALSYGVRRVAASGSAAASSSWLRLLLLLCAAVASRWPTFGNPVLGIDEEFYFTAARAMADGALPYVDVWDRKQVGLFLIYLPAAALPFGWGVPAYQILACASVAATAALIALLADRAEWRGGAIWAGLLYILWLPLAGGEGGQAPVFYNLLTAAAAALVALPQRRRRPAAALAMLLVGLALQVKCSVVFEGMWFGLWAMRRERRAGGRTEAALAYGAGLASIALMPTAAALAFYAAAGHADAFLFANFQSISLRASDPLLKQSGHLAKLAAILAVPVSLAWAGLRRGDAGRGGAEPRLFLRGWLLVAAAAILPMGTWFAHYGLPALLPAALCAAGLLGRPERRAVSLAVLAFAAVAGQALLASRRDDLGGAEEFAALAQAVGRGPGCLHVYSGTPILYAATGRCSVTTRIFPSHLIKAREAGATGVHQLAELRRVFAARPAVVVTRGVLATERRDARALAEQALARDYRIAAVRPLGEQRYVVHVRRDGLKDERGATTRFD